MQIIHVFYFINFVQFLEKNLLTTSNLLFLINNVKVVPLKGYLIPSFIFKKHNITELISFNNRSSNFIIYYMRVISIKDTEKISSKIYI